MTYKSNGYTGDPRFLLKTWNKVAKSQQSGSLTGQHARNQKFEVTEPHELVKCIGVFYSSA